MFDKKVKDVSDVREWSTPVFLYYANFTTLA